MICQEKIRAGYKRSYVAALTGVYLLIASLVHFSITFEWATSGDAYAETATNYYNIAISGASLFSQLLATDHGYISPILRIGPYIASISSLSNQNYIYLLWTISFFFVVVAPSIVISNQFKYLHPDVLVRAICALLISSMFNFESRIYINSSYAFIALIFIYSINYFKGGALSRIDMIIISLLILAKPLTIALIPIFFINTFKERHRFFFIATIFMLTIYAFSIRSYGSEYAANIDHVKAGYNTLVLAFYNIGKIFLFYLPSIAIKTYMSQQASILAGISALVGLLITLISISKSKNTESRNLLYAMVIVNILWSALVVIGIGASAPLNNRVSSDFNRYDLITALNILTFVALSKDWWSKKTARTVALIALIFTILIYSSASIYYFNAYIKKNILYIGTSTWVSMKDRPEYLGCALLSPLGWGYKCKVITNIQKRLVTPNLMHFDKEIIINIPDEMRGGFLVVFSKKKPLDGQISIINNHGETSNGENFNLAFDRTATVFRIECNVKLVFDCSQNLVLNDVELYASPDAGGAPLVALFNK